MRPLLLLALLLAGCRHDETSAPAPPVAPSASASRLAASVASMAAVAPPLDESARLKAEIGRRIADARARYGAAARTRIEGRFVVVEMGKKTPRLDEAASLLSKALPRLEEHFAHPPEGAITVLLFTDRVAYRAYVVGRYHGTGDEYGVYDRSLRELSADVSGGPDFVSTVTHEVLHPLLVADFPGIPLWLNEGIASLFEAPTFAGDGSIHGAAWSRRRGELAAAVAAKLPDAVDLGALFAMDPAAFIGARDGGTTADEAVRRRHYAVARGFCAWLDEQGELWPFYAAYRDGFDADPTGVHAFTRVTGGTPAEKSAAWVRWAK